MQTAIGAEIFMSTRECLTFADNLTLVVMDVEPGAGAGVVWLELRDEDVPLKSSILKTGESFAYEERGAGLNLTVTRIYVGGERDLVELDIESGEVLERSSQDHPADSDRGRELQARKAGSSLLNWGLATVLVIVLAAWVYFGARSR
ncbi:hypothetical protein [Methanocrinis sp.]|uniref:hypothetical protein n=1 Tax=Methanocrinis sp. TaxID=3101522 RepID=UPI003D113362